MSVLAVIALVGAGIFGLWTLFHPVVKPVPACVVATSGSTVGSNGSTSSSPLSAANSYVLSPTQADNAATIAGVGLRMGMPDHAVTVALATALQESKLVNLSGGDRDSAGLFQQRPSQGWGTFAQVTDPVHASRAFYDKLAQVPGWAQLSVTEAAQSVQRSAAPDGYAQWTSEATAMAIALTGEGAGGITCQNITIGPPSTNIATLASAELGTSKLSGAHDSAHGWAIASWLVAHAQRLGVDQVTFNGSTWTADSGTWSASGPENGVLTLHQVPASTATSTPATTNG